MNWETYSIEIGTEEFTQNLKETASSLHRESKRASCRWYTLSEVTWLADTRRFKPFQ